MVNNLDFACTACFAWLAFSKYNRGSGGVDPGLLILFPVVTARMGLQRSEKFLKREKGLRGVKEGGISARKAGQMRPGTEHEEIQEIHTPGNGQTKWKSDLTVGSQILVNWACKPRLWLGLSTDAFLKPLKKFLDKEVRLIRRSGSFPHHFTMSGSQIHLFFCNRLPDYPAGRILDNIGALQKY